MRGITVPRRRRAPRAAFSCRGRASGAGCRCLGDLGEELVVALRRPDLVDEQLEALALLEGVEHPAELPDLLQLVPVEQQLLVAGARLLDVDRRVDPPLGQPAVEAQLHVAGALDLLEDHLVHAAARLDEGCRHDRERSTLFDVPGRPEEPLRRVERGRVDTTRQDAAGRRRRQVVGAGEPRDAVEDDDDVLPHLDEPLRALDRELGDLGVLVGRPVEGAGDDLAVLDVTAHVGHLFGPLVHEQDHEVHLGVVAFDRVHDLLEDRRLARLRRRDDQPALTFPDRRDEVDDPPRDVGRVVGHLETELGVREQRSEVLELRPLAGGLGRHAVDLVDAQQRRVLLVARLRTRVPLEVVALAEREATDLRRRDVHVLRPGKVARRPEEPVPLVPEVEEALGLDGLALELARLAVLLAVATPAPAATPVALAVRLALVFRLDARPAAPAAVAPGGLGARLRGGRPGRRRLPAAVAGRRVRGAGRGRARIGSRDRTRLVGTRAVACGRDRLLFGGEVRHRVVALRRTAGPDPLRAPAAVGTAGGGRRVAGVGLAVGGAEDGVDQVGLLHARRGADSHRTGDLVELLTVLSVQDRSVEPLVTHGGKLLVLVVAPALELHAALTLDSELLGALVHRKKTSDNAGPLIDNGTKPMSPHAGAMPRWGATGAGTGFGTEASPGITEPVEGNLPSRCSTRKYRLVFRRVRPGPRACA